MTLEQIKNKLTQKDAREYADDSQAVVTKIHKMTKAEQQCDRALVWDGERTEFDIRIVTSQNEAKFFGIVDHGYS